MKLTTSLLIIALAASASAQQKPADQPAPVKSGTVSLSPAKPGAAQTKPAAATAPAKSAAAPATAKKAPATPAPTVKAVPAPQAKAPAAPKPVAKKVHKSSAKVALKVEAKAKETPAAPGAAPAAEKEKRVSSVDRSKRDPFQSVVRDRVETGGGGCAGAGKQCLVPDEVALKGIVRSSGSIIAVVTTKENRAYFLRENDPVFNGVVTRITEGSITFQEKSTDIFGKQTTREVVKKINPAAA